MSEAPSLLNPSLRQDIWPYVVFTPDGKWLVAGTSAFKTSEFVLKDIVPKRVDGSWLIGFDKNGTAPYDTVAFGRNGRWIAMGSIRGIMVVPVYRTDSRSNPHPHPYPLLSLSP